MPPTTRIGISGWTYAPWRGTFYPKGLKHEDELAYAASRLNSIEVNGTFYAMQRPASFAKWFDQTPDDFVFAIKGGRFITHVRRLRDVEEPLANFFACGILRLNQKLGPILWQLPPTMKFDPDVLDRFLGQLPHDTAAAAAFGRQASDRMKGRTYVEIDKKRPLRHAIEVRHASFATPEFIDLLRRHRAAAVVADTAGKWPAIEDATADFMYVRLHGAEEIYVSGYTDRALDAWATKVKAWRAGRQPRGATRLSPKPPPERKGRDVFVYFDNDVKVLSPRDAASLATRLGVGRRGHDGSRGRGDAATG
jgi:uncharacterized protein YecE (DUF72 family)